MLGYSAKRVLIPKIHDDFFDPDATDEEWLMEVGRKGWLVITHDKDIRCRASARAAIRRAGVGLFVLATQGSLKAEEKARIFISARSKIERFVADYSRPYIANVRKDGVFLIWPPPSKIISH